MSIDITNRKQAENALRKAEKLAAVGRLASSMSHEINDQLEAVANLLYLIERAEAAEDVKVQAYARLAQEELARVSQIGTRTLRFFQAINVGYDDGHQRFTSVRADARSELLANSEIQVASTVRKSGTAPPD